MPVAHASVRPGVVLPFSPTERVGVLVFVYTVPGQRGAGHGARLVAEVARWAISDLGLRAALVLVANRNARALRFYERAGFEPTWVTTVNGGVHMTLLAHCGRARAPGLRALPARSPGPCSPYLRCGLAPPELADYWAMTTSNSGHCVDVYLLGGDGAALLLVALLRTPAAVTGGASEGRAHCLPVGDMEAQLCPGPYVWWFEVAFFGARFAGEHATAHLPDQLGDDVKRRFEPGSTRFCTPTSRSGGVTVEICDAPGCGADRECEVHDRPHAFQCWDVPCLSLRRAVTLPKGPADPSEGFQERDCATLDPHACLLSSARVRCRRRHLFASELANVCRRRGVDVADVLSAACAPAPGERCSDPMAAQPAPPQAPSAPLGACAHMDCLRYGPAQAAKHACRVTVGNSPLFAGSDARGPVPGGDLARLSSPAVDRGVVVMCGAGISAGVVRSGVAISAALQEREGLPVDGVVRRICGVGDFGHPPLRGVLELATVWDDGFFGPMERSATRDTAPSRAHVAVARLCHTLGWPVFTSNSDGLLEVAGVAACKVRHDREVHRFFHSLNLGSVRLVVCVGVGADHRGLLKEMRAHAPDVRVISFLKGDCEGYLRAGDVLVEGDVQETVPQFADAVLDLLGV